MYSSCTYVLLINETSVRFCGKVRIMNQESHDPNFTYSLLKTLKTPSAVSSLAFGHAGQLFVGSRNYIEFLNKGTVVLTFC